MGGALRNVLNAQKLIDWLLDEHDIVSREEGVALCREFIALGVLRHGERDDQNMTLSISVSAKGFRPSLSGICTIEI